MQATFFAACTFPILLFRGALALHASTAPADAGIGVKGIEIGSSGRFIGRGLDESKELIEEDFLVSGDLDKPTSERLKLQEERIEKALARGAQVEAQHKEELKHQRAKNNDDSHIDGTHSSKVMRSEQPAKPAAAYQPQRTPEMKKVQLQEWPAAAISKDEQILLWQGSGLKVLAGGMQPEKVLFPEGMFVRKTVAVADSSAIMMEALVNDLYAVAGVTSPRCRYYPGTADVTKDYILCHIEGWKRQHDMDSTALYRASGHFVLDALLANYNLWAGQGNFGLDDAGKTVRIDNGGALASTGLGAWKRTEYNCSAPLRERRETWSREPFALWDLRSTGLGSHAQVKTGDINLEARSLLKKKSSLLKAVDAFNSSIATAKVKRTLEARLDCLSRVVVRDDLLRQVSSQGAALATEVCEGVRHICHDLLFD